MKRRGVSGAGPPEHLSRHKSSTPINLTQIAHMVKTYAIVTNIYFYDFS